MANIGLNKVEAAQRQIDTGIRMLFSGEDPVAIHTVAMAGFRIVRDLAAKQGDSYMHQISEAMIKPGKEKEFWSALQGPANFLKHADRDADDVLDDVGEEVNELILLIASMYYEDITRQSSPEMKILWCWCLSLRPHLFKDEAPASIRTMLQEFRKDIVGKPRDEQLSICNKILQTAKEIARDGVT